MTTNRPAHARARRPGLEALEHRCCPAGFSPPGEGAMLIPGDTVRIVAQSNSNESVNVPPVVRNDLHVPYSYPNHNNLYSAMVNPADGEVDVPGFPCDWMESGEGVDRPTPLGVAALAPARVESGTGQYADGHASGGKGADLAEKARFPATFNIGGTDPLVDQTVTGLIFQLVPQRGANTLEIKIA